MTRVTQNSYLREEYLARINNVIDYIESHIDQTLTLAKLSEIANFSPYHFHRIFAAIIGETLNQFIKRIRVERSASMLVNNPKQSITEVALNCGFSSSATFARAFKEILGLSASEWRKKHECPNRKNRKTESKYDQTFHKERKAFDISSIYIDGSTVNQQWRMIMKQGSHIQADVEIRELEDMVVAYVRHIGPYKGDSALFENLVKKLMTWAAPRNLLNFTETKMMQVYHDNPEITEEEKLRVSVCISIPDDTIVEGEIGKMTIPGGKYAAAKFELANDQFQDAWNMIFGVWLPNSGYQPDDRPAFEMCLNNPKDHHEHKHIVEIYVPVKPL